MPTQYKVSSLTCLERFKEVNLLSLHAKKASSVSLERSSVLTSLSDSISTLSLVLLERFKVVSLLLFRDRLVILGD